MNYYNEHDPNAAAWLRELIKRGLIPEGIVDEKDIQEVRASDLAGFRQCHFFAGIGGWPRALQLAGWPSDRPVWTGSCPCQPFSVAGRGRGTADERHLWPVFAELIREAKPPVVFGEQVASAAGRSWLAGVFADLEGMGYQRAGADLCAAGIGAPHIRQRLFWVAHAEHAKRWPKCEKLSESHWRDGFRGGCDAGGWQRVSFAAGCPGGADGELGDTCSICGREYSNECRCPGPTQDGYEYCERDGELLARRLANADGKQCNQGLQSLSGRLPERLRSDSVTNAGRVENPESMRLQGGVGEIMANPSSWGQHAKASGPDPACFWTSIPIRCADRKLRRISPEPMLFPLADGLRYRVGRRGTVRPALLKGAGNAIVPPLAAEFIGAYLDSI